METLCYGMLEGGSSILQTKGHYSIGECSPRGCEYSLVMIFFLDLDLVISGKPIHEGKGLMSGACIDNLIDEGCWEVVFGTHPIEIVEVCANMDGTLFFIHKNRIRNPSGVRNGVDEAGCAQILYLIFHRDHFGRMDGSLLLVHGGHIRPCVDVVFHDGWIQSRNFSVRPGKDVAEFLEESFGGNEFLRGAGCPHHDFFNNLGVG